jgi:hypothetical protein
MYRANTIDNLTPVKCEQTAKVKSTKSNNYVNMCYRYAVPHSCCCVEVVDNVVGVDAAVDNNDVR